MRKALLLWMCVAMFLPVRTFAQDIELVKYQTVDGSLSLLVPEGWHVQEDLNFFPVLQLTNDPDLLALSDYPAMMEPGDYFMGIAVMDADTIALSFPQLDSSAPFEQKARHIIDSQAETSKSEFSINVEKISFETLIDGRSLALVEAEASGLDMVISVHALGDALVISSVVGAPDSHAALQDLARQIAPTLQLVQRSVGGNRFSTAGDPLLTVNVEDAAWVSDFAPVNLFGTSVQTFKFQLSDPTSGTDNLIVLEVSGLPIDIEPGAYDVGFSGPITAKITVIRMETGHAGLPLGGMLVIDDADTTISGSFEFHTDPDEPDRVAASSVTGTFSGVPIPDVTACVIYSETHESDALASLHIGGGEHIEVDADEAVWIIEPGIASFTDRTPTLNLYVNSGERSYVQISGLRLDGESGEVSTAGVRASLIEITDGVQTATLTRLNGVVLVSSGNQISGSFDLMANGEPDSSISGDFSDIPIPALSCGPG